jgi:hypothetical protein
MGKVKRAEDGAALKAAAEYGWIGCRRICSICHGRCRLLIGKSTTLFFLTRQSSSLAPLSKRPPFSLPLKDK